MPSNPFDIEWSQLPRLPHPPFQRVQAPRRYPHVGQIVHYWPLQCEKTHDHDQPFRADICHVNPNGTVNLVIYNEVGIASRRMGVPISANAKSGEASMFPNSITV